MNTETTKELRIIALLDGRPGHEKQTLGIIQALRAMVPVQIVRIDVSGYSFFDKLLQTCSLYLPGAGRAHRRRVQAAFDVLPGDLLIGTGSRTHLPLLLYKKRFAIPAVTCMAPPAHLRNRFDLCCVPEHDGWTENGNIMLTVGAPNCSRNNKKHRAECGLILLGGVDSKSHRWNSSQVVAMVEKIVKSDERKIWTVSSSPRTPPDTVAMIRQLAIDYPRLHFFDYTDTPPGWIEQQYDRNSMVWVTADSISMIYEALTAGCRVGIFPMQWLGKNSKFQRNENILVDKRLVTPFSSWEQGKMTPVESIELNEARRCAERILQKWWPESR